LCGYVYAYTEAASPVFPKMLSLNSKDFSKIDFEVPRKHIS